MYDNIIIIGGGKSIQKGIELGLKEKLLGKFVITCNYAYKDFPHTFTCFQDKNFYVPDYAKNYTREPKNRHPDIYEELKKEPLILSINDNGIEEFKLNNTILLNKSYKRPLTGIFALELAIKFNPKIIYLLGFDWSRRTKLSEINPQIHYYNLKHKGSEYTKYYENHNPDKDFIKSTQKKDIKVYNVSLDSNINCFEKISYIQFFKILSTEIYNQNNIRLNLNKIIQ